MHFAALKQSAPETALLGAKLEWKIAKICRSSFHPLSQNVMTGNFWWVRELSRILSNLIARPPATNLRDFSVGTHTHTNKGTLMASECLSYKNMNHMCRQCKKSKAIQFDRNFFHEENSSDSFLFFPLVEIQ